MYRYSHVDRESLPALARWLLRQCGADGQAPNEGGLAHGAPGARHFLSIEPTGRVELCRTLPAGQGGGGALWDAGRIVVESDAAQLDLDPRGRARGGEAPTAPLPAAFRLCRSARSRMPSAPFRAPVESPGGIGTRVETRVAQRRPLVGSVFPLRGNARGQEHCAFNADRDLGIPMGAYEDQILIAQLGFLDGADEGYELRPDSALEGLATTISRLNDRRPRMLPLDTVIVSTHAGMTLLENQFGENHWHAGCPFYDGRPLYHNMAVMDGLALLHHPGIPNGSAFAMSSAQGPVFVHGTSRVYCADWGMVVTRQYGIVGPAKGTPGCPWGVRIGVEGDRGVTWHYG